MADYIKREDAIRELNAEGYSKNMRIHKRILDIPAADVRENVRGEWVRWARSDECSVCGYDTGRYEMGSNFCPNCGADMRQPEVK